MKIRVFSLIVSVNIALKHRNSIPGKFVNERDKNYPDVNGHVFKLIEDGVVDVFALENGFHNGPKCVLCGESWCHHCTSIENIPYCEGYKKIFMYNLFSLFMDERKIKPEWCYMELDPRYK